MDLISRQDAIDALEESKKTYIDRKVVIGKMQDIINNLPSAQQKGRWVLFDGYYCSVCSFKLQTTGLPSFCPNCGADMRGGGDE